MAELGTIAAAIELAQVGLKLRKFYSEIKDLPIMIRDLAEETADITELLGDIQSLKIDGNASKPGNTGWALCYKRLSAALISLNLLVKDLDLTLRSHRRTGAVRVFWKNDDLNHCKDRLERTKSTLQIALQTFQCAMFIQQHTSNAQQHSALLAEVRALAIQEPKFCANIIDPMLTPSTCDSDRVSTHDRDLSPLMDCSLRYKTRHLRLKPRTRSRYDLRLPQWILRLGLQVLVDHSNKSWGLTLRMYNRVSPNSEVFVAARFGEWDEVKVIFERGKSSPFDISENGETLLHIAAFEINASACRFLLSLGCEPVSYAQHFTPLDHLSLGIRNKLDTREAVRISECLEISEMLQDCFEAVFAGRKILGGRWMFSRLPAEAYDMLTKSVCDSYESIECLHRSIAAMNAKQPESIQILLGQNLSLSAAFSMLMNADAISNHRFMFSNIVSEFARVAEEEERIKAFTKYWRPILSTIVEFERRTLPQLCISGFPLTKFIESYLRHHGWERCAQKYSSSWNNILTSVAQILIRWLLEVGLDLNNYAKAEMAKFRALAPTGNLLQLFGVKDGWVRTARINCLNCGPTTEDWKLFAVPASGQHDDPYGHDEYEMAEAFWRFIEHPELVLIPGTFVPDESNQREVMQDRDLRITGPIF